MADRIMQGVRNNRDHRPGNAQEHYVKAAIAGTIAVGAYKMLRKDEDRERERSGKRYYRDGSADGSSDGGQGHNDFAILKLVAKGLGAAALAREVDKDLVE
ncbi:hypothetical protein DCS_03389 [Drechmeria coniospora]|uniref:Uncharacterized protein n=1 Tax=Drechmeria coniospora TaxID=98403 RepID=A0A151GH17_DRECN|nr:hypothetical protein DCS_03389 [Drechmeria coniospora]KYK56389.1 hypothetical protein DCS_03389 [Drechmeria coniospora]